MTPTVKNPVFEESGRLVLLLCFSWLSLALGCKESPQVANYRIHKDHSGLLEFRNEPAAKEEGTSSNFATPDGWTKGKPNPMFPSDKFLKTVGNNEVVMSIMSLPSSNDWLSNVQRWQGQVGIEKSADQIKEMTEEVTVDEISSSKVRLFKDDPESDAIVGIMSVKGNIAWFIKLMGKKSAVESVESEFDEYVSSIKLP